VKFKNRHIKKLKLPYINNETFSYLLDIRYNITNNCEIFTGDFCFIKFHDNCKDKMYGLKQYDINECYKHVLRKYDDNNFIEKVKHYTKNLNYGKILIQNYFDYKRNNLQSDIGDILMACDYFMTISDLYLYNDYYYEKQKNKKERKSNNEIQKNLIKKYLNILRTYKTNVGFNRKNIVLCKKDFQNLLNNMKMYDVFIDEEHILKLGIEKERMVFNINDNVNILKENKWFKDKIINYSENNNELVVQFKRRFERFKKKRKECYKKCPDQQRNEILFRQFVDKYIKK